MNRFQNLSYSYTIATLYTIFSMVFLFAPVPEMDAVPGDLPLDKVIHTLIFMFFFMFWFNALDQQRNAITKVAVLSFGFGLMTEYVQLLLPYRTASAADLYFDFLGAAVGGGVIVMKLRWIKK